MNQEPNNFNLQNNYDANNNQNIEQQINIFSNDNYTLYSQPTSNQNNSSNMKFPKNKKLGLILGILAIVVVVTSALILPKVFKGEEKNSVNNVSNNNYENNDNSKKMGIKKIDRDNYNTFVLKNDGNLYAISSFSPVEVEKVTSEVEDFIITDDGLFFTTLDKKSYIINGYSIVNPETYELIDGKNLETTQGTASLIELENIKSVVNYNSINGDNGERPILFLTEDGSVYKYIVNQSNSQHSFEKVMENIKDLYGDFYNKILVDNNNDYYAFGFNKIPSGILGVSDYSYGSSNNNYVTYHNKKNLGNDLKNVVFNSNSQHLEIYMIDRENNLSVIGDGLGYDYNQTQEEYINRIDNPLVFENKVEKVYPNLVDVYIKKTDGSLWQRGFVYGSKVNKKIVDSNVKEVYLDNDYDDGIFILMENGDLYAYGNNPFSKFGVGNEVESYAEPTKVFENVKAVYVFGSGAIITTQNNNIYYSGSLYEVSTWTKLEL